MKEKTTVRWSEKTDLAFYDNFLADPGYAKRAKGLNIKVVHLSAQEYIDHCATIFHYLPAQVRTSRQQKDIDTLKEAILNNNEIFLPILDFAYGCQEGMHRVLACEQLGIERIPVVFVDKEEE